jgi:hypothetical protein
VPFVNASIFGVLWYQGENNGYECLGGDADAARVGTAPPASGDPRSCGDVLAGSGYACSPANLVASWRAQWSARLGTTAADLAFGVMSLAAATSEGHPLNMANFRHAQTAGLGFLPPGPPGSRMERTFVAQVT